MESLCFQVIHIYFGAGRTVYMVRHTLTRYNFGITLYILSYKKYMLCVVIISHVWFSIQPYCIIGLCERQSASDTCPIITLLSYNIILYDFQVYTLFVLGMKSDIE